MAAQFPAECAATRPTYFVAEVPLVGFGSVVEYSMMFLARASHMGAQLVLGPRSSLAWTSKWSCGAERSLNCYFNVTGCCSVITMNGQLLELPRRRNPLNLGLPGFSQFGAPHATKHQNREKSAQNLEDASNNPLRRSRRPTERLCARLVLRRLVVGLCAVCALLLLAAQPANAA